MCTYCWKCRQGRRDGDHLGLTLQVAGRHLGSRVPGLGSRGEEAGGQRILTFHKILDVYEEPDDSEPAD